jgi:hypothetical protein
MLLGAYPIGGQPDGAFAYPIVSDLVSAGNRVLTFGGQDRAASVSGGNRTASVSGGNRTVSVTS